MEKELDETIEAKDKELKSSQDTEALATGQLNEIKLDYQSKLDGLRLMEREL